MSVPPSVSIVIPIWNAEEYLPELLTNVLRQEGVTVEEIILLDSHSTDNSVKIGKSFAKVQIHPEGNFSHGGTRNRGIGLAKTEIVVLLSQDALPSSPQCLLPLVKALEAPRTAYAFSRQIPYPKTNPIERGHIEHAFPETPSIYQLGEDESITQPEQIFCSNVCSAIKKSVWNSIPFREHLIMGEDQQ